MGDGLAWTARIFELPVPERAGDAEVRSAKPMQQRPGLQVGKSNRGRDGAATTGFANPLPVSSLTGNRRPSAEIADSSERLLRRI